MISYDLRESTRICKYNYNTNVVDHFTSSVYLAQNPGRGKLGGRFGETNVIRQHFTQPNSRFTKVTTVI